MARSTAVSSRSYARPRAGPATSSWGWSRRWGGRPHAAPLASGGDRAVARSRTAPATTAGQGCRPCAAPAATGAGRTTAARARPCARALADGTLVAMVRRRRSPTTGSPRPWRRVHRRHGDRAPRRRPRRGWARAAPSSWSATGRWACAPCSPRARRSAEPWSRAGPPPADRPAMARRLILRADLVEERGDEACRRAGARAHRGRLVARHRVRRPPAPSQPPSPAPGPAGSWATSACRPSRCDLLRLHRCATCS